MGKVCGADKVRTSQKRLRGKDVLEPEELQALLEELSVRDRAMVLLAASSGLRRSELVALTWADVDMVNMLVSITRAYVRSRFGDCKTEATKKPVPLHPLVLNHSCRGGAYLPSRETTTSCLPACA